jgi:hypothetical protein
MIIPPIERGVPLPPARTGHGQHYRYPFADMEPGDSFAVPVGASSSLKASATQFAKRNRVTFATRVEGGNIRCWRTA